MRGGRTLQRRHKEAVAQYQPPMLHMGGESDRAPGAYYYDNNMSFLANRNATAVLINKYGFAVYLQFALVKPYFGISFIICI